jgi:hypothetical protein
VGAGMAKRGSRKRRTDYGTVVLHLCLIVAIVVLILSGLRIATENPDSAWINEFDFIMPRHLVWTTHMKAAVALIAIALAYPLYVARAGLSRRIRLDRVRLAGLFGRHQARWGAINITLYWMFFLALLSEIASGTLMYFDYANDVVITLHLYGMWFILGYILLHVLTHFVLGGVSQLLRVLRPSRLMPQPPPFDPIDLLDLLDQPAAGSHEQPNPQSMPLQPAHGNANASQPLTPPDPLSFPSRWPTANPAADMVRRSTQPGDAAYGGRPRGPRTRGSVLQANPFVVSIAVAITVTSLVVMAEHHTTDTLVVRRVSAADVPVIDGDSSDRAWRMAEPYYMDTDHGGNFDGKGETTVEVRAVHDSHRAYFLFTWDDPTRSLKQLPLMKTADGWKLLHDGYESGDEHAYNEDKFSVLFTTLTVTLAGDRTFHASNKPLANEPRTMTGRGLHYTEKLGLYADVWEWKATSTNPSRYLDDDHFGPPIEASRAQAESMVPYHGGFASDPGTANYANNFAPHTPKGYGGIVLPLRLPKDVKAMTAAMGTIDINPNHGESEGARWYMTEAESVPYSRERDAKIPVGTVVPGVIISGTYSGDRADVRCAARWAAGRWTLEAVRRLDTGSRYDIPIKTGTYMRVSAFDHTQIDHTRHVRPIRLEVK